MKKWLFLIVLGGSYWYWSGGQLPFMESPGAFDDSGKPLIWVFTFEECGDPCSSALKELRNRNANFEEKKISPDDQKDSNYTQWERFRIGTQFPIIVAGKDKILGTSTPAMATLLGKAFGDVYLTSSERRYFKKHFNEDGTPRIVMYGTDWCPYCTKLRNEFYESHVKFVDINVEAGDKEAICQTMGIGGYPATWVGYTRVMKGAEYSEVMNELNTQLKL
jgi:glutaredoxin